jgi:hypothetical protein
VAELHLATFDHAVDMFSVNPMDFNDLPRRPDTIQITKLSDTTLKFNVTLAWGAVVAEHAMSLDGLKASHTSLAEFIPLRDPANCTRWIVQKAMRKRDECGVRKATGAPERTRLTDNYCRPLQKQKIRQMANLYPQLFLW